MKIIINPKTIGKKSLEKIKQFNQVRKDNPKEFLRFGVGLVLGLGIWIVLNGLLSLSTFLMFLPLAIIIILALFTIKILGLEDLTSKYLATIIQHLENLDGIENTFQLLPPITNLSAEIVNLITEMTEALTALGKAFFANFAIMFPVLLDININLDWLHVSPAYLIRTFFNIVQFAVMYYIFRKIKRKIKDKINLHVEVTSKEK